MHCSVIAISRTLGAGGEDLGLALAAELGFRYVDAEIIQKAADAAGVSTATLEKVEARKPLIARILDNMARSNVGALYQAPEFSMAIGESSYESLISDVIRETAAQGNVVIVAHGASIPLAGMDGLLRVMVTAPADVRAARVAAAQGLTPEKAASAVADSDKSRADYFRRFYNLDRETSINYDITVNTHVVNIDAAKAAILAAVRG
ncbi:MAG: cytidylate kinase-like family protein [Chloroflexi bacterium]|nr:cytidylate kinase-like family protein [Chloroflexota bacterium]